jgi:hypothetical protein
VGTLTSLTTLTLHRNADQLVPINSNIDNGAGGCSSSVAASSSSVAASSAATPLQVLTCVSEALRQLAPPEALRVAPPEALRQLAPHQQQSEQALLLKVLNAHLLYWRCKSTNTDT